MKATPEGIVHSIAELLRCRTEQADGTYRFMGPGGRVLTVDDEQLSIVLATLNSYRPLGETYVATNSSSEMLVQPESHFARSQFLRGLLNKGLVVTDKHDDIVYIAGAPSAPFLLYLILTLQEQGSSAKVLFSPELDEISQFDKRGGALFEFLRSKASVVSLQIQASQSIPDSRWDVYADSFLFHVSYNLDAAMTRQRYLEEVLQPARISRMRRSEVGELDAPRRSYVSDLVYHYQLGVAAETPMLEFISYYHIAEHWFESIFQQDLVENLQTTITSPDFSHKRKGDIQKLIKTVTDAVRIRDDQIMVNEQTALLLTLQRYVVLHRLVSELERFDPTLLDYYASNRVSFSGGNPVDLRSARLPEVWNALAQRIYKTRNSLVHSKEGAKARYVPFSHDKDLLPEIPLLRFIAEQIIIESSSL
ncbi:hypothetical protein [Nocardia tengchongensis]